MQTQTLHFERFLIDAEGDETLGDVLRRVADLVDELRARPQGVLTAVEVSDPNLMTAAVVVFRVEGEDELYPR